MVEDTHHSAAHAHPFYPNPNLHRPPFHTMAPLRSLIAATLLFLFTANAQFELLLPPPLEGDKVNKDLEATGPCGGGVPDLSSNTATDFHVGGDSVAILLGQPQANILIGATLDSHAASNWTQLLPIIKQSGRGNFCEPAVTVPKEWAGKKGFIGVVSKAPDAERYQVGPDQPCRRLSC